MATEEKKPTPAEFKFDLKAVRAHIDEVVEYHNGFVGKKGHNPFFYLRDKVNPLIRRMTGYTNNDGSKVPAEATKELHDAIMALTINVPPVVSTAVEPKQESMPLQLVTSQATGEVGLSTKKM